MIKNYILRNKQVLNDIYTSKQDYTTKQKQYYDNYYQSLYKNGVFNDDLTSDQLQKMNEEYSNKIQEPLYKYQNYSEVSDPNFQANDYISLSKLEMQNLHDTSGFIQIQIIQEFKISDIESYYKSSQSQIELQKFQYMDDLILQFQSSIINIFDQDGSTQKQCTLNTFLGLSYDENKTYGIIMNENQQNNIVSNNITEIQISATGNMQNILGCYKSVSLVFSPYRVKQYYTYNSIFVYMKVQTKTVLTNDILTLYMFSKRNTAKIQYLILESDQVNGNLVCQQDKTNNQTYSTFNQNTLAVITPQENFQYDNQFNDVHMPLTSSSGYMQFKLYDQNNNEFDQDVFQIQIQLYQQKVFQDYSSSDSVNKKLELHTKKQAYIKIDPKTDNIYFNNFQAEKISISKVNGYTNTCCVEGNIFYMSLIDKTTDLKTQELIMQITDSVWNQTFVDKICDQMNKVLFVKTNENIKGEFSSNGIDNFVKFKVFINQAERSNHLIQLYSTSQKYPNNVAYQFLGYNHTNTLYNGENNLYNKISNNQTEQQIIEMYCQQVGSNINEQLFSVFSNYDYVFQKCDSAFVWKEVQSKTNKFKFYIKQLIKNQNTNQYELLKNDNPLYIKDTNIDYIILRLLVK